MYIQKCFMWRKFDSWTQPQWQKSDDMTNRTLDFKKYCASNWPYIFSLSLFTLPTIMGTILKLPFLLLSKQFYLSYFEFKPNKKILIFFDTFPLLWLYKLVAFQCCARPRRFFDSSFQICPSHKALELLETD